MHLLTHHYNLRRKRSQLEIQIPQIEQEGEVPQIDPFSGELPEIEPITSEMGDRDHEEPSMREILNSLAREQLAIERALCES